MRGPYRRRLFATASFGCVLVVVGAFLAPGAIADEQFRCGSRLVYYGMSQAAVREYCGAPTSELTDYQRVRAPNNRVLGTSEVQSWTYESYSATRVLVFVDGKLQRIKRF